MNKSDVDYRRPVSETERLQALTDVQVWPWEHLLFNNPRLESLPEWDNPQSADFRKLNDDQRRLVLVALADGEICNGGMCQLFFNKVSYVPSMQEAFADVGCSFAAESLASETYRLSQTSFVRDWKKSERKFANFFAKSERQMMDHYDQFKQKFFPSSESGNDPATEAYYNEREETLNCIRRYIQIHWDNYMVISN